MIPDRISTLLNLSAAQIALNKFSDAIANLSTAIKIDMNCAEAYLNLGLIQVKLKNFESACQHFIEAIKFNPNYPEAWSNKGNALNELKRHEEVIASYEQAIKLNPKETPFLGNLLHFKMVIAQWDRFSYDLETITSKVALGQDVSEPFPLPSLLDDPSLHLMAAETVVNNKFPSKNTLPPISRNSHSKIRIGYFSPDFKSHPLLMAELFELHNRNRFETYAFSLQPANQNDPLRQRLLNAFDHFLNVENKLDLEIAQLSRDLKIDIAINLGGHTQNSRMGIFSYRATPIQVNYLGYPGTSGANYIDYIIGDKILIPTHSQKFYTEKVVCLPNSYMVDNSIRLPSTKQLTKNDFGLPDNKFIFCCFNNSYKFNPQTLQS